VPYKQAFLGIGWVALSRLSTVVSTFVFGNRAGDCVGGKAVFGLATHLEGETAVMSGILGLTIVARCRLRCWPSGSAIP
jgi:hypothetical protein